MSKRFIVVLAAFVWLVGGTPARGDTIELFEWAINDDGVICDSLADPPDCNSMPSNWGFSGFDFATGLGTLTATITGAGSHSVLLFLDIEIDEVANTFSNEVGGPGGTLATGQSWEVDEPGFTFGDIYDNLLNGTLDNAVGTNDPEDVSVALGWAFTLGADEVATLTFEVGLAKPTDRFYLVQYDPDSDVSIYFSSTEVIRPIGVPEPATLMLLGTGLLLLGARVRSRR